MNSSNMPLPSVIDGVTGLTCGNPTIMICSAASETTQVSNNSIPMFIMTSILR